MYERVSEMKGFPYENVSRRGGGGKCRGEDLGNNSSLWQLEEEVSTIENFSCFSDLSTA